MLVKVRSRRLTGFKNSCVVTGCLLTQDRSRRL